MHRIHFMSLAALMEQPVLLTDFCGKQPDLQNSLIQFGNWVLNAYIDMIMPCKILQNVNCGHCGYQFFFVDG